MLVFNLSYLLPFPSLLLPFPPSLQTKELCPFLLHVWPLYCHCCEEFLLSLGASIPPPGKLTVQTINITAVLISWSYSYDLPSPIYFYVQCSVDGDPFVNISGLILFGGGTTSYVYHGLRFQAFYQFQVIASFGGESSEPSSPSNAFINGVTGKWWKDIMVEGCSGGGM